MAMIPRYRLKGLCLKTYDKGSDTPTEYKDLITSEYDEDTRTFGKLGDVFSVLAEGYWGSTDGTYTAWRNAEFSGTSKLCFHPATVDTYPRTVYALDGLDGDWRTSWSHGEYVAAGVHHELQPSGLEALPIEVPQDGRIYFTLVYDINQHAVIVYMSGEETFASVANEDYASLIGGVYKTKNGDTWVMSYVEAIDLSKKKAFTLDPKAMLLGWMMGKQVAGLRDRGRRMTTAYGYGGVVLPGRDWDEENYPHAMMVAKDNKISFYASAQVAAEKKIATSYWPTVYAPYVVSTFDKYTQTWSDFETVTEEGASVDFSIMYTMWTNRDVVASDDETNVVLYATSRVPVDSGWDGPMAFAYLDGSLVFQSHGTHDSSKLLLGRYIGWEKDIYDKDTSKLYGKYYAPWLRTEAGNIRTVTIDADVSAVSVNHWFADCAAMETINRLPSGVREITGTFKNCYKLTSLTIPEEIETIGKWAFHYCHTLKIAANNGSQLPQGLKQIGESAFAMAYGALTKVDIPDGMTEIPKGAFNCCMSIQTVTIPASVTKIGAGAFLQNKTGYTSALSSVTFADTEGWWVASSETATSGTAVDVTNPSTNAAVLKANILGETSGNCYWFKGEMEE